jgi:hypothetical protein
MGPPGLSPTPAIIGGVRVSIMKTAVTFLSNPIGPKHRMPFRKLDSAFFHQELKELVSFGDIKVIRALGLFYPPVIHSQRLLSPHNFSSGHFLIFIKILHLVSLLEELVVDVSYVMMFLRQLLNP